MQEQITALRLEADKLINSVGHLDVSREIALTGTSLQLHKMWLGKALAELGVATPYVSSESPESKIIEPEADKANASIFDEGMDYGEQVANVKKFRAYMTTHVAKVRTFIKTHADSNIFLNIALKRSLILAEEAKMWLGMELNRQGKLREQEAAMTPVEKDGTVEAPINKGDAYKYPLKPADTRPEPTGSTAEDVKDVSNPDAAQ